MSTPASTSSSRKRKADALESAGDGESLSGRKLKVATTSASAHLPASCLAAILNFMEYGEVRRCLLAGKMMAVEAARYVETLSIMNASELVPSAARRFANVTEVNILSLTTAVRADEDGDEAEDILSAATATRSVLFLTSFPKLERAFLGGIFPTVTFRRRVFSKVFSKIPYHCSDCHEPKDHLSVFRGLVDQLCGAFRSRSLSPSLHLEGFIEDKQWGCDVEEREDDHGCRLCRNVVTSFPLDLVLKKIPTFYCGLCLNRSERIEALATRHDNPLRFQPQAITKCFLAMAGEMSFVINMSSHPDRNEGYLTVSKSGKTIVQSSFIERIESFIERIESQGGRHVIDEWSNRVYFNAIPVKDMEDLKKFANAIGPSVMNSITKRELLSALDLKATNDGKKHLLARQTFESLVELGFDLASKDFVLIDPLNEVVLENYHHLFRSEEEVGAP